MKKRNRLFALLFVLLLTLFLAACGGSEGGEVSEGGGHQHVGEGWWQADFDGHWQLCGCGEKVNAAPHELANGICTVCRSAVVDESGVKYYMTFNEHDDPTGTVYYGEDGTPEIEERAEYTYDAAGVKLSQKNYSNGKLTAEYEYTKTAAGDAILSHEVYYYEDGTKNENSYDDAGYTLSSIWYDAAGVVESRSECSYNDDHSRMREKSYSGDALISEREYVLDAEGLQTMIGSLDYEDDGSSVLFEYDAYGKETREVYYDADGAVLLERSYENNYDGDGNYRSVRIYENGVLIEQGFYTFGEDEEGSWSMRTKTIYYEPDGIHSVEELDPNGAWRTEVVYDAEGSVRLSARSEYTYDGRGNLTLTKMYENDVLVCEIVNTIAPDDEVTWSVTTDYYADGSRSVSEFKGGYELAKETRYDAAGNVTEEILYEN